MNQDNEVEDVEIKKVYKMQSSNTIRMEHFKNMDVLCPQLKSLNISFCGLSKIPKIIFNLKHLTELDLSNNNLISLPNELGNLHNLLTLNLSRNNLIDLPNSVKFIHNLKSLDISSNVFMEVPDILFNSLGVIKVLDMSFNNIRDFDCAPQCINTLTVLKLSCNKFINMPKWIFYSLCQLKMIDIGGNCILSHIQMNDFCVARVFDSLQFLNVENCSLSSRKIKFLSHFKNLEVLYMGNKQFKELHMFQNYLGNLKIDVLKNFKILRCLYMQCVQLSTLPAGFDCLKHLEILDLSENLLSWLPECLCNTVSLKILNLTSNQLIFLPNTISNLVNLQELHVGNNNLYFLPNGIYDLNNLVFVDFYNNKLEELDFSICKKEKLKGIDVELNCVQHCFSETDDEAVKIQYDSLKNCLRQHFNYADSRFDGQIIKTPSEDENCSVQNLSNCSEFLSDDDSVATTPQKQCQDDFKEEDWEDQVMDVKEEDFFNPNEVKPISLQNLSILEDLWSSEFRDNYCPAYSHEPSIIQSYVRNVESTLQLESVDGQFDSD